MKPIEHVNLIKDAISVTLMHMEEAHVDLTKAYQLAMASPLDDLLGGELKILTIEMELLIHKIRREQGLFGIYPDLAKPAEEPE